MKIFLFNKPKQTIVNILFVFGLVSLLISFLAIGAMIIWNYYPKSVSKVEKIIPDFYGDNIRKLHRQAKEAKNEKNKLKYFSQLYNELKNISTLNKYYRYRQESARYLINTYVQNKKNNEAFKIAEKWEKNYPYDFTGKFIYIDTVSIVDENLSSTYIENLYNKHSDIKEVKDKYIDYLLEHGDYNEALELSLRDDVLTQNYAKFQLFYIDNSKGFSQEQSIRYDKDNYKLSKSRYSLKFNKKFDKFRGLRVDVDSVNYGTNISDITLNINGTKIDVANVNHLERIAKNKYKVVGNDSYFVFNIPKQFQNYAGEINIDFISEVSKNDIATMKVFRNKEWQFFVDNGKGFNEKESTHFIIQENDKGFSSKNIVDFKNTTKVRIDFPSLKSSKIKNIKLIVNSNDIYDKKDIVLFNNIRINNDHLEITGNDPFLVINLKKNTDIKKFEINIIFDGT